MAQCKHGFKYLMVKRVGLIVEKSQAGFLYVDDVCPIASNEQDLQRIYDSISEYGMKISEKLSKTDLFTWSKERENVEFLRK